MKTWMKVLLVAVPVAVVALPLGQIIWPVAQVTTDAATHGASGHVAAGPTVGQIVAYLGYSAIEAIFFGLGVAFLAFGMPLVRRFTGESRGLTWAVYAACAWLMMSWLPHGGWHRVVAHDDVSQLLMIEYVFHAGSQVFAGIVAYAIVRPYLATATQKRSETQQERTSALSESGYGAAAS